MEIGFCGLGGMGAAMVARLLEKGHRLTVWNRTADKAKPLLDQGASWAATPAEVTAQNEVILTCLFDDAAIMDVYASSRGLLAAGCCRKLFIETSTIRAQTTL